MSQTHPTLIQAILSIDGAVREQLSHLSIDITKGLHVTCHTGEPTPGPSGPLATDPDLDQQLHQLQRSALVGALATEHRGNSVTVTLWSDAREQWQERMATLRAHPHAGRDLLERAAQVKAARMHLAQAQRLLGDRAVQARTAGLAQHKIDLLAQPTGTGMTGSSAAEAPPEDPKASPSRRPLTPAMQGSHTGEDLQQVAASGFVRMPMGHSQPCVVCGTPATQTLDGQPLHQGECATTRAADTPSATAQGSAAQARSRTSEPAPAPVGQPAPAGETTEPKPRRATSKGKASSAPDRSRFRAAVAAWDGQTLYLPAGVQQPLTTVRHLGELAELAATHKLGHGGGAAWPDRGEILVYPAAAALLGLPEEVNRVGHGSRAARARAREEIFTEFNALSAVQDALAEGWELSNERMDVRTLVKHPERLPGGAQVTVLSWSDWQGNPLFAVSARGDGRETLASPDVVVDRLQEWADRTGLTWRVSGGQTGVDMVDVLHVPTDPRKEQRRGYFVRGQEPVLPDFLKPAVRRSDSRFSGPGEEVFSWCRPWSTLLEEEKACAYVLAFDHSGNFRGPFLSTEIGVRDLVELHGQDAIWDGTETPGYWAVTAWETPMWNLPDPADAAGFIAGMHNGKPVRIVTAHTLKQLEILDKELPHALEYHQAWIWRDHGRVLSEVGRVLTEAGKNGSPEIVAAQKQVYSQMVQKFASVDYPPTQKHLRQPPIRDMIVGAARTSIMRTIVNIFNTTGRSPLAVSRDTIFYACDTDDTQAAWPGDPKKYGTGPGQWKPMGIAPLAEWGPACLPDPGPNEGRRFDYGRAMNLMTPLDPETGRPLTAGEE